MGRMPTPTALKVLRGNPGKRPLNKREPKPQAGDPHMPDHLDEAARAEWKRLVPMLREMRVLTEADYLALANLCVQYSTLVSAQKQLNKSGLLLKTPNNFVVTSPLIGIVARATKVVNDLCREFGLTPSARSRVQTSDTGTKAEDPWERFA
jgi:P27 family predicted phage terminase small subunit